MQTEQIRSTYFAELIISLVPFCIMDCGLATRRKGKATLQPNRLKPFSALLLASDISKVKPTYFVADPLQKTQRQLAMQ